MSLSTLPSGSAAHAAADRLLQQAEGAAALSSSGTLSAKEKAKIQKAGSDFESLLLGSWLQGAESSFATAPGGAEESEDTDGSRDQFLSLAMQQLAGSLVAHGGIGISKVIVQRLEGAHATHPAVLKLPSGGPHRSDSLLK